MQNTRAWSQDRGRKSGFQIRSRVCFGHCFCLFCLHRKAWGTSVSVREEAQPLPNPNASLRKELHQKYTLRLVGKPGTHGLSRRGSEAKDNDRMPTAGPEMRPLALKVGISPSFAPWAQLWSRDGKLRVSHPRSRRSCRCNHTCLGLKIPPLKVRVWCWLAVLETGSESPGPRATWDILCWGLYICAFSGAQVYASTRRPLAWVSLCSL